MLLSITQLALTLKHMAKQELKLLLPTCGASSGAAVASEVSVILKSFGASKVQVIKAVQTITGLGLMDAKKIVDSAPVPIKETIVPSEAE